MNNALKLAIAAVAVVVVALVGINLLPRSEGVGGSGNSASPGPSPTASPSASLSRSPSPSPVLFPNGPLPAGSHTIQPFVGSGWLCLGQAGCTESAEDDSIRITVTVPDGWSGFEISVAPSVESFSPPGGANLLFMRGGWLHTVWQVCGGSGPDIPTGPNISTGTTVDEFVTALVDHPDLDVTSPVDVTLAGYSGKYLELQAPDNIAANQDSPAEGECAYYFVWEPGIYAQGPNAQWRIWVLDVDGVRVVVRGDSFPGTSPQSPSPTPVNRGLDPDRALTSHRVGRPRSLDPDPLARSSATTTSASVGATASGSRPPRSRAATSTSASPCLPDSTRMPRSPARCAARISVRTSSPIMAMSARARSPTRLFT